MYFSKKHQDIEEVIIENTSVFSCVSEDCNGWMRAQFTLNQNSCPLCGGEMNEEIRQLPKIT